MTTNENNKNIKVLLVDDEIEFAATLAARLKLRHYSTNMATSGEKALVAIDKETPDVLVLDLKMPDFDGIELLTHVKSTHPTIEVIILTGHGSFEAGREGMELGAFGYLMKPVDLHILLEQIEKAYLKKQSATKRETK